MAEKKNQKRTRPKGKNKRIRITSRSGDFFLEDGIIARAIAKVQKWEKSIEDRRNKNIDKNLSKIIAAKKKAQKEARAKVAVFGKKVKGKRVRERGTFHTPDYLVGTGWD
tara:strand:+ start:39 stop:368 length:330 start_codon:yes stop_codon:yes gene_type:complete